MHRVHRDLKYENVLFVNTSPRAEVKLIDFGLAKQVQAREGITEGVGTMYVKKDGLQGVYMILLF